MRQQIVHKLIELLCILYYGAGLAKSIELPHQLLEFFSTEPDANGLYESFPILKPAIGSRSLQPQKSPLPPPKVHCGNTNHKLEMN